MKNVNTDHQTPSNSQPIRFLRKKEVMHLTGLSSSAIYDLMNKKVFPQSIKLTGGKAVAWLSTDIEQWQQDCIKTNKGA